MLLSRVYSFARRAPRCMVVVLGLGLRDIDVSRLRLSRRARKARSHVDLDPEFSSLSRYMSKIFGLERHDDTTFCRRSAGKVGTTLSNGRHTCRTCTRCHSGNACASRDGIHARRHLFIAGIFVGSFSRAAFSWFPLRTGGWPPRIVA